MPRFQFSPRKRNQVTQRNKVTARVFCWCCMAEVSSRLQFTTAVFAEAEVESNDEIHFTTILALYRALYRVSLATVQKRPTSRTMSARTSAELLGVRGRRTPAPPAFSKLPFASVKSTYVMPNRAVNPWVHS